MNGGQEKNKRHLLRAGARTDFKLKKSAALDVTAVVVSVIAAFLVWVFTGTL